MEFQVVVSGLFGLRRHNTNHLGSRWQWLSRGASGIRGQTLILNVPGSLRAAVENLEVVLPALPHGLDKLRGSREDCG